MQGARPRQPGKRMVKGLVVEAATKRSPLQYLDT